MITRPTESATWAAVVSRSASPPEAMAAPSPAFDADTVAAAAAGTGNFESHRRLATLTRAERQARKQRTQMAATHAKLMKLKAVKSFMADLDRAERVAADERAQAADATTLPPATPPLSGTAADDHHGESLGDLQRDDASVERSSTGLVTTRRYSGRMQTGCVGGCY